jgi:hypothetical protein
MGTATGDDWTYFQEKKTVNCLSGLDKQLRIMIQE